MTTNYDAHRGMKIKTPLDGEEPLFRLMGISGREAISQLFKFQLDLLVENERDGDVDFAELLGEEIHVEVPMADGKTRHFNGICSNANSGGRNDRYASYTMELVPKFWLLTRRSGCRVFQRKNVPEIIEGILGGVQVEFESLISSGDYPPRDFCVQYRETDANFISRLMEEEGIFYYFEHSEKGHKLVLMDSSARAPKVPGPTEIKCGGSKQASRGENHIVNWRKSQKLTPSKLTLRDYSMHQPDNLWQIECPTVENTKVGTVEHKLKVRANEALEVFQYPGEFAHRYDGTDGLTADRDRLAQVRMDQQTLPGLLVRGTGSCRQFTPGHTFNNVDLDGQQADGDYLLTSVEHFARTERFEKGHSAGVKYYNSFACIPTGLNYRPPRRTPKPFVQGPQTAVVVGPPDEDIHTDEFGRVKIRFHWDLEGKDKGGDASCWVRVAMPIAGQGWGMIHIPRVGHEVVVAFRDGDPDQPMIIGGMYNAMNQPPKFEGQPALPQSKTLSGIKTHSTPGGVVCEHFNELRFEDKKGKEEVYLHAEKDFTRVVEDSETATIKQGDRSVFVEMGDDQVTVKMGNQITNVELGKIETEAMQSIELKVGPSSLRIDAAGVWIDALNIGIRGKLLAAIHAPVTTVTADGATTVNAPLTNILSTGPLVLKGAAAGMTF